MRIGRGGTPSPVLNTGSKQDTKVAEDQCAIAFEYVDTGNSGDTTEDEAKMAQAWLQLLDDMRKDQVLTFAELFHGWFQTARQSTS